MTQTKLLTLSAVQTPLLGYVKLRLDLFLIGAKLESRRPA